MAWVDGTGCRDCNSGVATFSVVAYREVIGVMKLQLPYVTLVCIDTICHELAALAVSDCADKVDFGGIHIYTDDAGKWGDCCATNWYKCEDRTLNEVAKTMWYEVPKHIETSHTLFVHWDSGIDDPSMWTDEFLQYDYIGAPWGWHADGRNVGNGGFSLRSSRLIQFIKASGLKPYNNPEDDVLCRQYGEMLRERTAFVSR